MIIFADTNVILDYLAFRTPHNVNAEKIFDLIIESKVTGYVSTSSVTDIYYILRRTFSDIESREKIRNLLNLFQAVEVAKNDCFTALDSPLPDFEDALVTVCADKIKANFIVTRDIEFLKIPKAISPGEFLEKVNP